MRLKNLIFVALIFLFGCAPKNSFRFAWLSDTHVSPTTTGAKDLSAAVHDINHQKGIQFVIVSGDITDSNFDDHLLHAKRILDSLNVPYYIIPGNHDSKWTGVGLENFKAFWGDDKFVFDYGPFKFIGLHQGPELRMADGHFSPDDLQWLKQTLHNLKNPRQPLIFVTHYPLAPPFLIDNYFAFMDIIKGYNVKMILNGHGHRNKFSSAYGIPQIMDRSSLRGNKTHGGYNIVDYHDSTFFFRERVTGDSTLPVWAKVSVKPKYLVIDSLILRPDYSINQRYPKVQTIWKNDDHHLITASPVVLNNNIFIGDVHGSMHCFNLKNGKERWQFNTKHSIYAPAAVFDSGLVFTCTDSSIYCLNPKNGELNWKFKTQRPILSTPIISNDTVFTGSSEHKFWAIDGHTGAIFWEYRGIKGIVETKPLLYKNKIIFAAWDQTLYALNRKDGTLIWQWKGGRPHPFFSPAACWPVGANQKIFIVAPDRFMTAIEANTGQTVWRSNHFKVRETIGISRDKRRIFAKCMRDTVFAMSPFSTKPRCLWVKNFGFGYDFANSMIEEKEGIDYFGTKNGLVIAFNGKTGQLLWEHKIDNSMVNTVLPVGEKRVAVTTMNGKVVLLNWQKK